METTIVTCYYYKLNKTIHRIWHIKCIDVHSF